MINSFEKEINERRALEKAVFSDNLRPDNEIVRESFLKCLDISEDKDSFLKSWSSDLQNRFPDGGWRTINGARVFINGGKVIAGLDGFNDQIDKFFEGKKKEGISKMHEGKADKALNRQFRFEDGNMSWKQRIDSGKIKNIKQENGKYIAYEKDNSFREVPKAVNEYFNGDYIKKQEFLSESESAFLQNAENRHGVNKRDVLEMADKILEHDKDSKYPTPKMGAIAEATQYAIGLKNPKEYFGTEKDMVEHAFEGGATGDVRAERILELNLNNELSKEAKNRNDKFLKLQSALSSVKDDTAKTLLKNIYNRKEVSSDRLISIVNEANKISGGKIDIVSIAQAYQDAKTPEDKGESKKETKQSRKKIKENETPSLKTFEDMAVGAKDVDKLYKQIVDIKNVPSSVSKEFFDKYNPTGKLDAKQTLQRLVDSVNKKPKKETEPKTSNTVSTKTIKEIESFGKQSLHNEKTETLSKLSNLASKIDEKYLSQKTKDKLNQLNEDIYINAYTGLGKDEKSKELENKLSNSKNIKDSLKTLTSINKRIEKEDSYSLEKEMVDKIQEVLVEATKEQLQKKTVEKLNYKLF